jgi:hypothetical protein
LAPTGAKYKAVVAAAMVMAISLVAVIRVTPASAFTAWTINDASAVDQIKYVDYISPANANGHNGATVWLWSFNGQIQQQWVTINGTWRPASNTSMCLDGDTNTAHQNPQKVQLWQCNGQPQQVWLEQPLLSNQLVNQFSGKCLDADTNTAFQNPQTLQAWECNGQFQQEWFPFAF